MLYVIYGAVGVLAALVLLGLGFAAGWKASRAWREHARRTAVQEATEEERRRLEAEQRAFEGLMGYNRETAYGIRDRKEP